MRNTINPNIIKDFIYDIKENLDEITEEKNDDLNYGQRLAFTHMLRTIKGYILEEQYKDFGLDIDIDKKYL